MNLCSDCGSELLVVDEPPTEMVEASNAYVYFKDAVEKWLGREARPEDLRGLGMCPECGSTALLGPEVVVQGCIVEEGE